jgi:transmembrane sensor
MRPAAADAGASQAHAALRQAAEWFAVLHGGEAGAEQHAQWQRWMEAAPEHRQAWQKIEAVNQQFGQLPPAPALAALKAPHARRSAAKKLLALAACLAVGTAVSRRESRDYVVAMAAGERTGVGEMRQLTLADGSGLWMNTDSALDLDWSPGLRRVALHRGEILLRSGSDPLRPARPLVVDLLGNRLTALGTRFSVFRSGADARLAVFEGAVRVELGSGASRTAAAGTQLHFGADWIGDAEAADEQQSAWTRKRLSVERMRLGDFVATLARYRHGYLGCSPAVADLLLTGSYPLDDLDRILAALEKTLPVRVQRLMPWWVTLEPAAA